MIDDDKESALTDTPETHRAAVANTLTWAEESASRGDYVNALAWLNVLDAIRETLPEEYEIKRRDWRRTLIGQHMPRRTGGSHRSDRGGQPPRSGTPASRGSAS